MLVPILLCTFLGIFLDRIFHTSFIVILLFFLGAFAGFRNIYIFAKSSTSETSYIGSDAKSKMDSVDSEGYDSSNEDFFSKIDRLYKENTDEQN